jgi:hypothetical protein
MNLSQFNISLQESISLFKKLAIFKDVGKKPVGQYSSELKKIGKENRHKDFYQCAIKNIDYEIILIDDSIFQFSYDSKEVRYAYIQNPSTFISREEYLEHFFTKEDLLQMEEYELEDLLKGISDFEYEQFLNEQEMNITANYIRYDATLKGYRPLLHSYSHIHIGNNQDLRIPSSKTLTPLMFSKFSMKNSYYPIWKKYYKDNSTFKNEIKIAKTKCTVLPSNKWNIIEQNELYLT